MYYDYIEIKSCSLIIIHIFSVLYWDLSFDICNILIEINAVISLAGV